MRAKLSVINPELTAYRYYTTDCLEKDLKAR